jgi:hypothetical protein
MDDDSESAVLPVLVDGIAIGVVMASSREKPVVAYNNGCFFFFIIIIIGSS